MPPAGPGEHLVGYLFKVGPAVAGEVLSFTEIANWSSLTGTVLSSWEAETLRQLSAAHLDELHAAKDPKRPAPTRGGGD